MNGGTYFQVLDYEVYLVIFDWNNIPLKQNLIAFEWINFKANNL